MNIDWNKAPEWAKYHAFDKSMRGYWYEYVPSQGNHMWIPQDWQRVKASKITLSARTDWRGTLMERPKP